MMAFSSIGVLVGLSAGVVFAISFENYNASVWGVMSALAAALVLYIKTAELKDWYSGRPQLLRVFMYCGCFLQLIGVTGFVAYITLAIDHHQGLIQLLISLRTNRILTESRSFDFCQFPYMLD